MIVYLHGFNSSPASGKAKQLGEHMASLGREADYFCPTLPNSPREAIVHVEAELAQHRATVTLIGSSLGGFYATHLAEKHGWKAVLVNPAVHAQSCCAARSARRPTGTPVRSGCSPRRIWPSSPRWMSTAITRPERYLLLAQTGDEVLDYRDAVAYYAGATQIIEDGGDHGFAGFERHYQTILDF